MKTGARTLAWIGALTVLSLAADGLYTIGSFAWRRLVPARAEPSAIRKIPVGTLPGPPRESGAPDFVLNDENSIRMSGIEGIPQARREPGLPIGGNVYEEGRWMDIAGNLYKPEFIRRFRYDGSGAQAPLVRIRIDSPGPTLQGRLEARRLKPNFAYQIKLRGNSADRTSFEAIGFAGRWRLPGWGTNYSDFDYMQYSDKSRVESYLLFDFFVTDSEGNAVRNFALDSSLHVLWNATQRRGGVRDRDLFAVIIDASDPDIYYHPQAQLVTQWLWAARERRRYQSADQTRFLPAGNYQAEIVLTEESFHGGIRGEGFWATVLRSPVEFVVED